MRRTIPDPTMIPGMLDSAPGLGVADGQVPESHIPGWDGLAFYGTVPNLKTDDGEGMQPRLGTEVYVEVLNLSQPPDLERYEKVMQLVGLGKALISAEERVYDPDIKSWRIFLRWIHKFAYSPKGVG